MKMKSLYLSLLATIISISALAQFTGKPQYLISTTRAGVPLGDIKVELFPLVAPKHVRNFDSLVSKKFFDTTAFHRVIPGFMIQGGDPNSRHGDTLTWGYGDPSQPTVNAEFSAISHQRGILSAARDANINSANSQFFICVAAATHLNNQYSVYGRAVSGMNIVDSIVRSPRNKDDKPFKKIEMFITYLGSNDSVPEIPKLMLPVDNTKDQASNALLRWNPVNTALLYRLEVATDSAFKNIYFEKEINKTSHSLTKLPSATHFYWRVTAKMAVNLANAQKSGIFIPFSLRV